MIMKDAYGLSIDVSSRPPCSSSLSWERQERTREGRTDLDTAKTLGIFYSGRTVVGALGTGGGALVARVTRDTHDCGFCSEGEE